MMPTRLPNRLTWLLVGLLLPSLAAVSSARDAPQNLRDFYDAVRDKGHCYDKLAKGFYSQDSGSNTFSYCGDHLSSSGIIYLQGRHGALANMDVDCDGSGSSLADDGRCRYALSPDIQNATSFRDVVVSYGKGIADLNPYVHPYVVFGNARGTRHRRGWRSFDPADHGMQPLSAMAAVCPGYRLVFGVWGDMNGDDDARPMVGEASLSFATACAGRGVSGNNGIDEHAILYIGFTGAEAVPGPDGADWAAQDPETFEKSIEGLGNRLVERIRADESGSSCTVKADVVKAVVAAVSAALVFWILDQIED